MDFRSHLFGSETPTKVTLIPLRQNSISFSPTNFPLSLKKNSSAQNGVKSLFTSSTLGQISDDNPTKHQVRNEDSCLNRSYGHRQCNDSPVDILRSRQSQSPSPIVSTPIKRPSHFLLSSSFTQEGSVYLQQKSVHKNEQNSLSPFKRYQESGYPQPSQHESLGELMGQLNRDYQQLEYSNNEQMCLRLYQTDPVYFTEEQIPSLKKELQYESRGQVSKSTEYHTINSSITKISFKCKSSSTCPYLSQLLYENKRNHKNQKLYRLVKVQEQHHADCQLQDEEVRYNVVTRLIDQNLPLITQIIAQNTLDIKPKVHRQRIQKVLDLFAQNLGHDSQFIYFGIQNKARKRAVKKYFDNSVAKAKNIIKAEL